jgi:hypothetical protein
VALSAYNAAGNTWQRSAASEAEHAEAEKRRQNSLMDG